MLIKVEPMLKTTIDFGEESLNIYMSIFYIKESINFGAKTLKIHSNRLILA